jgi:copper chaperone CopZ
MAAITFIIPEEDNAHTESLRTLPGVQAVRVAHKPFDSHGADAELQPFEESLLTISYDAGQLTEHQIRDALRKAGVHVLAIRKKP